MIDLIMYVPEFLREIIEMQVIQSTINIQANELQTDLVKMQKQKFIQTSTGFGLNYWDKEYGLSSNATLNDNLRREIIIAKIRGVGTTTIEMIKSIAESFSGATVIVTELSEIYTFEIYFIGTIGIPQNIAALIAAINECKPAHLDYRLLYRYTTWGELLSHTRTWSDFVTTTWETVKIYEEA